MKPDFGGRANGAAMGAGSRILGMLDPLSRAALEACARRTILENGAVLQRADQAVDEVLFIERGVVSVTHRLPDGVEVEIALIGPEGMLGPQLALGEATTPVVWRACTAGTATRVARADFMRLLGEHPAFRALVLAYANAFMLQISQSAACAAKHTIPQRLARWILMCHAKSGQSELEITHHSIARALGVRRAGVTGALHTLEGAHAIRSVRGRIILRDTDKLRALACGCPTSFPLAAGVARQNGGGAWRLRQPPSVPAAAFEDGLARR